MIDQAGAIAATNHVVDVDIKQVALVLQEMKGIPITNVLRNDTSRLRNIKDKLSKVVKGQEEAIQ